MEEKKPEDRNETLKDETLHDGGVGSESASDNLSEGGSVPEVTKEQESEEKEERRGLFGAKKRERNDKMVMGLYAMAGVYLLYTAFMTAKELIEGKIEPGRDTIINIAFVVIFASAAVWILISSWRLRNILKAQEKEEAERLAAERAERGEAPEEPAKGGLFGGILARPEMSQPSVASRASVYYNPADEEEEEAMEEERMGAETEVTDED
ncbi:MAG: hypothetical protein HFI63_02430 [Lachnospiraceae bacterium]|nr:hypothetical protein [Lachnospiraceae bacterium]